MITDTTLASTTARLKSNGTVTANFIIADSVTKCYPHTARIDLKSSIAQRIVTFFFRKPLTEALTANTVLHAGSVSLGKAAANTDSTVTDTLLQYPGMPGGYYRLFATDPAWANPASDTLLNGVRLTADTLSISH
jgi:hypothetical protein